MTQIYSLQEGNTLCVTGSILPRILHSWVTKQNDRPVLHNEVDRESPQSDGKDLKFLFFLSKSWFDYFFLHVQPPPPCLNTLFSICVSNDGQQSDVTGQTEKTGTQRGKTKTNFESLYLGAEELALANQFLVLVEFDAMPETHAASAKQTWKSTKIKQIQVIFISIFKKKSSNPSGFKTLLFLIKDVKDF